MNALILCDGAMHDSHSIEIENNEWQHPARSCAVSFRISLPNNNKTKFEELSGFKLSQPDVITA
jgi:hypothetical protein